MTQVMWGREQTVTAETVHVPLAIPAPRRRRVAVAAVTGGLVAASAAFLALSTARPVRRSPGPQSAAAVATPTGSSLPNVGLTEETYAPGQSSGWHRHAGVHSVVVLSGTLTIYDQDCVRHDYGPGSSYIGGQQAHVARNEQAEPLGLVVTYVSSPSAASQSAMVDAPPGCDVR